MCGRGYRLAWLCGLAAMLILQGRLAGTLRAGLGASFRKDLSVVWRQAPRVLRRGRPSTAAPSPLGKPLHRLVAPVSRRCIGGHVRLSMHGDAESPLEPAPKLSCWVRCVEDEPHLSVAIGIGGKESILHRMQDDPLQTTLDRLRKLVKERFKQRSSGKKLAMDGGRRVKKIKGKGKGRRRRAEADAASSAIAAATAAISESTSPLKAVQPAENSAADEVNMAPESCVDARIWVSDKDGNEVSADLSNRDALIRKCRKKVFQLCIGASLTLLQSELVVGSGICALLEGVQTHKDKKAGM